MSTGTAESVSSMIESGGQAGSQPWPTSRVYALIEILHNTRGTTTKTRYHLRPGGTGATCWLGPTPGGQPQDSPPTKMSSRQLPHFNSFTFSATSGRSVSTVSASRSSRLRPPYLYPPLPPRPTLQHGENGALKERIIRLRFCGVRRVRQGILPRDSLKESSTARNVVVRRG